MNKKYINKQMLSITFSYPSGGGSFLNKANFLFLMNK